MATYDLVESPLSLAMTIHDLAAARLRNLPLDTNVEHDLREISRLSAALIAKLEHIPQP